MPSTSTAAVTALDLVKTYPGRRGSPAVRAVDGLSLSVPAGTVFGLLGPNGAGKSTTVKILTTLTRPDSGAALVGGIDAARDPEGVRRVIGLVGQKPSSDPMATGRENLVLAGRIHGLSRRQAAARADELLIRFDLVPAAGRLAKSYSGGMARKLDVAIGLMHRPSVLFLDEPTTGLDPEARTEMWAEIERLRRDEQVTVLLTTHYLEEADRLADRLAIVDAGRVVVEGSPDELKAGLRGDAVEIDLADEDAARRAADVLHRTGCVTAVAADRTRVRARADSAARTVPAVLAALDGAGIAASSVRAARPSLDDVYLHHVGRAYRQQDAA